MYEGIWACILVLVLHCWSGLSQHDEVLAHCNEDIRLPCSVSKPGSNYRYIIWYRNDTPIIKRKINNVEFFNQSSPASLGVQDTLVLQNAQPSDNGYYQCYLAAEVGQKDKKSYVSLTVSECVTVIPTWTTAGNQCPLEIVDVSVLWSLLGFSFISILKIILSTTIVIVSKRQKRSKATNRSRSWGNGSHKPRDKLHL